MRDLAGHQESQRIFDTGIVRDIDEPLIDDLGTGFRRDVRAQVGRWLADRIDIRGCPSMLLLVRLADHRIAPAEGSPIRD
jgi:hypothetical protein